MRYFNLLIVLSFFSCNPSATSIADRSNFGIVIHGGAGTILQKNMTPELEQAYRTVLAEAVSMGHSILKAGGSSQEAVEKTIRVMEDSPLFNAGKGSVLSNNEEVEMDASIMTGDNLNAGAVSGIKKIKNPITLARKVMKESEHIFLSGSGDEDFAV